MRLYGKLFLVNLQSQMQYKVSFFLTLSGQLLASFSTFLGLWFIFSRFHQVEGFTLNQVLLCYAVVQMSFSLAECFARGFDRFPAMISNGEFDRVLVRPRSAIFQILAYKMEFTRLGRFLQALFMLIYAVLTSGVFWGVSQIITLLLMILCGCIIISGLFLIYAGFTFFTIEGLEFMNILTDGGREFGRYPYSVYGREILKFLTFVVPLALYQYYPLLYLLGKSDRSWYMFLPLAGTLFLLPCYAFWRFGLFRYKSTGS
jgi:ABC-2 type transport system permease protein